MSKNREWKRIRRNTVDKKNILSILPVLSQPRYAKRIDMLKNAGFKVEAVAFEREYHRGRSPDCRIKILGKINHGHYLRRVATLVTAMPAIRRYIRRNDIIYAYGLDMALTARIAGMGLGKPMILEIGDIRELQVAKGWKGDMVRAVEKQFIKTCSLLVATSADFINCYYRQWLKLSIPSVILENKLESAFEKETKKDHELMKQNPPMKGKALVERPLSIGYFGLLRCEWSWKVLEAFARTRPEGVKILLAGYIMNPVDLKKRIEQYENIKYFGEYRSPQDLPTLYNSVDLVWACYQPIGPNDWNLRWARTNRFYESCFFKKPIIARAESGDGIEVDRHNIGLAIKEKSIEKVIDKLCHIESDDLDRWKEHLKRLHRSLYIYTTETSELSDTLRRF